MEPVSSRQGIDIALKTLLEKLCTRLGKEQQGIRTAIFTCFRIDNHIQTVEIGTSSPSNNPTHLFNLFDIKLESIEPGLGFEVFVLQATTIEKVAVQPGTIWGETGGFNNSELAKFLDKVLVKLGKTAFRYLPAEHYWPERSIKKALSLVEQPQTSWNINRPRPLLLQHPTQVEVTAPVPDYPPMHFKYRGKLHKIVKADSTERIEPEWWLSGNEEHRDYYYVEDEEGQRYWLFRAGHYDANKKNQWYLHGFFP
jgi:protein ImuB